MAPPPILPAIPEWMPNPGHLPENCIIRDADGNTTGFRPIWARLFNGRDTRAAGTGPWPSAGAKPPTCWTISRPPHAFEIKEYMLA